MLSLSSCVYLPPIYLSLGKYLFRYFAYFFVFLLMSFQRSLYSGSKFLLHKHFANIVSQFVVCLSSLSTRCFKEQKFLIFMKSILPIVVLQFVLFVCYLRNFCLGQVHKDCLRFPSRNFIVLAFAFRSVIYFDLTFIDDMKCGLRSFFFSCYKSLIVPAPFIEITILLSLSSFDTFVENQCNDYIGLLLHFVFCAIYLYAYPFVSTSL